MKKGIVLLGALMMTFSVGAATGVKINAELKSQSVVCGGSTTNQEVISYKGTTYVPLRKFGELTGATIDYKEGKIYVGGGAASDTSSKPTTSYNRNNPAPIGTSQTVSVDNFSDKYTAEVCIKEVIRGDKAWEMIKNENQFNDPAPEGHEYILAKISVKAINVAGDKSIDAKGYDFKAYSATNAEYKNQSVVLPKPELRASLYAGASTEGWVDFVVSKTDQSPKVVYGRKYDGTGGIWFSLK